MKITKYMKTNYKIAAFALLLATASCSFTTKKFDPDPGEDKDEVLVQLISLALNRFHYQPEELNDEFSADVYEDYIYSLDPLKRFFLKSDIEEFSAYKTKIDDQIKQGNVDFFNLTYNRLLQRIEEAEPFYKEILSEPFDYSKQETINTDYEELEYASNKKELKNRWRKQLKFSTLSAYYEKQQEQKDMLEFGQSSGVGTNDGVHFEEIKTDSTYTETLKKTDAELEAEAREITRKSLENFYSLMNDQLRKDWFSIYLNSIVEEFDPHTFYFAPQDKDRFDIQMSGSLEGIGARLQKKIDNITVVGIVPGGPAWRDEELQVGDEILKVKQEDEKEPVSIVGMRLADAVDLIKGPKGTIVTLTVRKVDGTIEEIEIVRDVVELQATYAKSAVLEKNGKLYGIIDLPQFYFDMKDYGARNAYSDMKKEIIHLKEQGMDGLVIDLRGNGGGSLRTVVDIAGLFIKEGPVVQVKYGDGSIEVLKDEDNDILWNGPLVIMVDELSASASEILAAAMQDYKRAVIIGSEQTYGKGTVQRVLDLNRLINNNSFGDMGALKITTQKFYRIDGGSTQLRGVSSDVVVPDRYSYIDIGEREMEDPLPWDKIEPADFEVWDGYIDYAETIQNSKMRMEQKKLIDLIEENAKWIKEQQDVYVYPLQYAEYSQAIKETEAEAERFDAISEYTTDMTYTALPYVKQQFAVDSTLAEKRDRWHENLSTDIYVEEAIHVLQDLSGDKANPKVATVKEKDE